MQLKQSKGCIHSVWIQLLTVLTADTGPWVERSPRGQATRELVQCGYSYDSARPVLTFPGRKLNYRFMAAEALWIIDGRNDVDFVRQYNSKIGDFAPLGLSFYGAYGPPYVAQRDYVVSVLLKDRHTRQACMSFWQANPPSGMDIPCNDFLVFRLHDGKLHLHVTARSKDVWLGLPYDVFTFAVMLYEVTGLYNKRVHTRERAVPGNITFTDASLHLYERDLDAARAFLAGDPTCNQERFVRVSTFTDQRDCDGTARLRYSLNRTLDKTDPMPFEAVLVTDASHAVAP